MRCLVYVLPVLMTWDLVLGFTSGPPVEGGPVCSTMEPAHGHPPSTDPVPYEILVSQECYKHGQTVKGKYFFHFSLSTI